VIITLIPSIIQSQNEASVWVFGNGQMIDFKNGCSELSSNMRALEGCASICDEDGNLLFYSNGGTFVDFLFDGIIWDRNGDVIVNMQNKGGGSSSTQSCLFTPDPADVNGYYLFTMEQTEESFSPEGQGLSYFKLDRSLNGGLGDTTAYVIKLLPESQEALAGTIHSNQRDYWIVALDNATIDIVVFLVNEDGVEETSRFPFSPFLNGIAIPKFKFSPDGRWLSRDFTLLSFDNSTGIISNPINLNNNIAEFTADSKYAYARPPFGVTDNFLSIFRYDLTSSNIATSEQLVETVQYTAGNGLTRDFQLGPDGNIYFLENNNFLTPNEFAELSRIVCPSSEDPCVEQAVISYEPGISQFYGLPNFLSHYYKDDSVIDTLDIEIVTNGMDICDMPLITLEASNLCLPSYLWSTGETTPSIIVTEPGTYTLEVSDGCCKTGLTSIEIKGGSESISYEVDTIGILGCDDEIQLVINTDADSIV